MAYLSLGSPNVGLGGQGFADAISGAMGQLYGINQQNQQQNFANNYADAQFGAYRYNLDQQNAQKQAELAAQSQYLNSALQGSLGLGNRTLDAHTGLGNRGLDLQGTLGNRNLDILSQEQANKFANAQERNEILKSVLSGFGGWFGGGSAPPATGQPPAGAPVGDPGAPLGGAPTFSPGQYQGQPSGFTTNFGQSAGYRPGQPQMYPQMRAQQGPPPSPAAPAPTPSPAGPPPGPAPGGPPTPLPTTPGAQDPQAQISALLMAMRGRPGITSGIQRYGR